MKNLLLIAITLFLTNSSFAAPGSTHDHTKHNMVLFGTETIYASHIVYKDPHHFQVILSLDLDAGSRAQYLAARKENPEALFLFLLDPIHIRDIQTLAEISGPIFYKDSKGERHDVIPSVKITRENFNVIYFDELPLSLEREPHEH